MAGMNLPRFTLRDMFLATTLIAVGIGVATLAIRYASAHNDASGLMFVLLACTAIIGAGIGTPFHQKWFGAGCALLVVVAAGIIETIIMFFMNRWE
jgi:hypothetical protein